MTFETDSKALNKSGAAPLLPHLRAKGYLRIFHKICA